MRKLATYLFFVFLSLGSIAQNQPDRQFIEHLVNKANYREALFLIDKASVLDDSLYYFKGWSHYSLKELEASTNALLHVSNQSNYFYKSRYFAAYNYAFGHNYQQSTSLLADLKLNNPQLITLRSFQLSGIDLLNRNYKTANQKWTKTDSLNPIIYEPLVILKNISKELQAHKKKSPLLAGIMSAIVPGSGKFYVGKKGEGIAAFIMTVGVGAIAYENYKKLGIKNVKTIAFGSLFAANYVSNIYGSVHRAKIIENDYQDVMQNQILFHMHIPLRNFFE